MNGTKTMNFSKYNLSSYSFSIYSVIVLIAMSFVYYAFWDLRKSKEEVVHEIARTFSGVINSAHKLYTRKIVPIARKNGLSLSVDYKNEKGAIPWPETFSHELGKTMSEVHPNTSTKTYSNFPHTSNQDRILDDFQVQALKELEQGAPLFFKIYESKHGEFVRYAKPIRMIQLCADCHNNPKIGFTKQDWKKGDFVGVREVKFPFPKSLVKVESTITNVAIVLTTAVLLGLFVVAPMLKRQTAENSTLSKQKKKLQVEANTDPLTGLYNRRYLEDMLGPYLREFSREDITIGVIAMDIDHFKDVNDTHGHDAGDEVLVRIADCLRNQSREHDIIARTGGEEFIVVVPVTGVVQATHLAERYRRAIENAKIRGTEFRICPTASFGVVTSEESKDSGELLKLADSRLYQAKRTGRNKVVSGCRLDSAISNTNPSVSEMEVEPA